MRRVCDRLRSDLRLGFNCLGAVTACIVNAARVRLSLADSRLGLNFVGAATACILNAGRVRASSG